ncbi:class I SAM-dependent methyltransferase [Alphaproteobacteria bacterium]|nr:class I SAM-dependent methyltransferase [Alphaproteobacteria bacterium]
MKLDQLINKQFHILQRNKINKDKNKFIYNEISSRINLSIDVINLKIKNCLEVGFSSKKIEEYICSKYPHVKFYFSDISLKILNNIFSNHSKICFDHDQWPFKEKIFDLIISNYYLHFSNNFDLLLNKINYSLNDSGFFIATLPGNNTLPELKHSMIEADIEMYGGAYQRFMDLYSIEKVSQLLKKNNFKNCVIERDTLKFYYNNFYDLLKDLRCIGNSNIYHDRKSTFEKKNYFKKVENIYCKKYSNNKKLIAQIEVIYISGWKE